jgi:conjugal transfer/type IV secretion protein DotA/TraY
MNFKLDLKRDSLPADIAEIAIFGFLTIGTFVLQRPLYEALAAQRQFGVALVFLLTTAMGAWLIAGCFRRSVDSNGGLLSWLARLLLAAAVYWIALPFGVALSVVIAYGVVALQPDWDFMFTGVVAWSVIDIVVILASWKAARHLRSFLLSIPGRIRARRAGRNACALMILLAIGVALMPSVAMAQAASSPDIQSIFTPSATDISVQLLNSLFPSLTNPLGNTGAPPATQGSMDWSAIAKVIAMFNAGLLIIGGAMLTYNIVSGVAQTAHEGAVLGKNWSSLWAPIRVVIGIGALAPIPGSGYCAAQIIVGKAALIGVGLASYLWTLVVGSMAGGATLAPVAIPGVPEMMFQISEQAVCVAVMNKIAADTNDSRFVIRPAAAPSSTGFSQIYGNPSLGLDACGSISMDAPPAEPIKKAVYDAQVQILTAVVANIMQAAANFVADSGDGPKALEQVKYIAVDMSDAYSKNMLAAASAAISANGLDKSRDGFVAAASAGGWATSGAWYMTITRLAGQVYEAADHRPMIAGPRAEAFDSSTIARDKATVWTKFLQTWHAAATWTAGFPGTISTGAAKLSDSQAVQYWLAYILPDVSKWPAPYDAMAASSGNQGGTWTNPLQELTAMGHSMIMTAEGVWFASSLAKDLVDAVADSLPIGKGAVKFVARLGSKAVSKGFQATSTAGYAAALPVFLGGLVLAYILPMMPAIFMLFSFVSWAVLVVEALVAAPIWAMAHLQMDGEGMAGNKGTHGYEIILNLLIQPSLMLFGMLFSIGIFSTASYLWTGLFKLALMSASVDSFGGVIGLVSGLVMFVTGSTMLAYRSFSLMSLLPNNVPTWLGIRPAGRMDPEGAATQTTGVVSGIAAKNISAGVKTILTGEMADSDGQPSHGGETRGARTNKVAAASATDTAEGAISEVTEALTKPRSTRRPSQRPSP